jgi:molybdopterin molybdotransferase
MAISLDEARNLILKSVCPGRVVDLPLDQVAGRVLAEEVVAPCDLPAWNNSAMDGYAVFFDDCTPGAHLSVTGFLAAGVRPQAELGRGCAVKIMTGAALPEGADTVVPVEDAEEENGKVFFHNRIGRHQHVRFLGEDVKKGELALPEGTLLRPAEVSLLAAFGFTSALVYAPVKVAVIATGDELTAPGEALRTGQIHDSSSLALAAAIRAAGGEPVLLGIAGDNRESLLAKLQQALVADVIVTTAGVSAGDLDLVRCVLDELGLESLFWRVDIKPGRPTAFGLLQETPVFSLPGNPVSSLLTFEEFVRPALRKMMGYSHLYRPLYKAKLSEALHKKPGRVTFLRVKTHVENGTRYAASAGDQNTGILTTLVKANAVAILPAEVESVAAGEWVEVYMLYDEAVPAED